MRTGFSKVEGAGRDGMSKMQEGRAHVASSGHVVGRVFMIKRPEFGSSFSNRSRMQLKIINVYIYNLLT